MSAVDSSVSLAYFYFDFRDSEKERCSGLISSLIDQLASRCSDMPTALERLYAIHRNGMERPNLRNLVAALEEMIMNITCRVYIVIDALDECSERKNLMTLIEQMTKWNLGNLHMLFTSRKEEDLNRVLLPLSVEVNLESSLHVHGDIAFHVRTVLQNDPDFSKWQPPQKLAIETRLTEGAHGVYVFISDGMLNLMLINPCRFRWVSCQLDSIRGCRNVRSSTKCLATLPKTLYETHDMPLLFEPPLSPAPAARATLQQLHKAVFAIALPKTSTARTCTVSLPTLHAIRKLLDELVAQPQQPPPDPRVTELASKIDALSDKLDSLTATQPTSYADAVRCSTPSRQHTYSPSKVSPIPVSKIDVHTSSDSASLDSVSESSSPSDDDDGYYSAQSSL